MQMPGDIFVPVTVKRYAAGTWSGGRHTAGAETTVTITACVQPGGMKEMMSLEEGERTKDLIAVWTPSLLRTIDEVAGTDADRILFEGAYWQVRRVESFGITPELKHYHVIAIREQAK